jgi:anti-anti-sigma factor
MTLSIGTSVDLTGGLVITARGSLDDGGAVRLSEAVSAAVDRHRPDVVHLDLGQVTDVDPIGAAALEASRRSAVNGGTRVVLRNPTAEVARSLQTTGLMA